MRPLATLDCETDPFKRGRIPRPFIWGFYDNGFLDADKPFRYFTDNASLIEFLSDKEFVVYAHNGGKFDYHYLLEYVSLYDEVSIINGRLAKFNIGICEFRDSFNILPVPLSAYEKMEFDYGLLEESERSKPENWAKIVEYLESDCRNLFEVVDKFVDRFGLQLTQAGAAMKQWVKVSGRKAPRSDATYYDELHPYYYGGRCECFQVGIVDRPFKVVDINSAYPFAMIQRHPYGLDHDKMTGESARTILEHLDYEAITTSFFKVRAISHGAFPYRDTDKSLCFPNDSEYRDYTVTGWELAAAVETGTLQGAEATQAEKLAENDTVAKAQAIVAAQAAGAFEVIEAFTFGDLVSFTDYIYKFYNERKIAKRDGDKATDLFSKLLMNSLYGKFASNPAEYKNYLVLDADCIGLLHSDNAEECLEYEGRAYEFGGYFGPHILAQAELDDEQQRYYNIATSASITGFVRAYLWRHICRCSGVLYCDTDSIAAERVDVPLGIELGQWEIEGDFTKGAIAGRKLYAFKYAKRKKGKQWKTASKGVRLKPAQIVKVAEGGRVKYMPEAPTYSVRKSPVFIPREITMLDKNVKRVTKGN